ncbi:Protein of unknown function DUF262 [Carpediemonas membranifera]|uniref:GmrSD restriction endonucleases N-terminal domain-containing protein n=1 Tax=Carpediemonas membranifera TaxID=201153 RepID=A0A8J6BAI0_9EUKA|nr:Protein of unknown function DUF262 [Carpediemonas membranifera]|eukprot:KAG9397534.1 Protein of unknown function DUF262 [Carpediemonas membranifera]
MEPAQRGRIVPGCIRALLSDDNGKGIAVIDNSPFARCQAFNFLRIDVPLFQRRFCWTSEIVRNFFLDVSAPGLANDPNGHTIGKMWFKPEDIYASETEDTLNRDTSTMICIDGQQRMTTITLLLAALRDGFAKQNNSSRVSQINRMLFNPTQDHTEHAMQTSKVHPMSWDRVEGKSSDRPGLRFIPTHSDRVAYTDAVLGGAGVQGSLVSAAKRVLDECVKSAENLDDILENLLDGVRFVLHEVVDQHNKKFKGIHVVGEIAKIYFSIKRAGIDLAESDLVRNLMFTPFPLSEAEELYFQLWLPLEDTRPPAAFDDFLAQFLNAKLSSEMTPSEYKAYRERHDSAMREYLRAPLIMRLRLVGTDSIPGLAREWVEAIERWGDTKEMRRELFKELARFDCAVRGVGVVKC